MSRQPPLSPPLPSRLIGIADADTLGDGLVERVCLAVAGGVDWVLLRAKGWESEQRLETARRLLARCPGLTLSMHTDALALEQAGCGGLHVASGALIARHGGMAPSLPVGVSCHNANQAAQAAREGADYAFLSPVYPPTSKRATGPLLGVEGFAAIAQRADLPLFALGGMTPERVAALAQAGASGVAVLGDLFLAEDIEAGARRWMQAVADAFEPLPI